MHLYRRGDRGPVVAEIRAKLARLDLLHDGPAERPEQLESAEFDADCDRAVRAFQQRRGLTVDGIVGPETWQGLIAGR